MPPVVHPLGRGLPRPGRRLACALACGLTVVALAACSSDKKNATPEPSTTTTTTGSGTAGTTSSTALGAPTTAVTPMPVTTSTSPSSTVAPGTTVSKITGFTVMPSSPVSCNAPTMIELKWTSSGVRSVALLVDGKPFATYGPGFQDHLEYFACDGKPHTYTLQARQGTSTSATSVVVTSA